MNDTVNNVPVQEEGIDLRGITHAIFDRILWIVGAVVLCVLVTFIYTKATFVPMFTSNVTIYTNSGKLENTSDVSLPTFYAEDFAKIAVERGVLEKAVENLKNGAYPELKMTWASLKANLTVMVEEESRVVYLSVSNPDPETAQALAKAVSEAATEALVSAIGNKQQITTITEATLPTSPSGSGAVLNSIIAALVGLIASCGTIIAIHIIRDRVNSVEDVENALGLTILGVIPFQKKKSEYSSKRKGETEA